MILALKLLKKNSKNIFQFTFTTYLKVKESKFYNGAI